MLASSAPSIYTNPPQPSRLHIGQHGYVDPRLFEDYPLYLMPLEEIPNGILELFDDWGQSVPINIEALLGEVDLWGVVVGTTMEPKQLEYEGTNHYDYVVDIQFKKNTYWRKEKAWGIPPNYFVLE